MFRLIIQVTSKNISIHVKSATKTFLFCFMIYYNYKFETFSNMLLHPIAAKYMHQNVIIIYRLRYQKGIYFPDIRCVQTKLLIVYLQNCCFVSIFEFLHPVPKFAMNLHTLFFVTHQHRCNIQVLSDMFKSIFFHNAPPP